jgi:hypothetical protein
VKRHACHIRLGRGIPCLLLLAGPAAWSQETIAESAVPHQAASDRVAETCGEVARAELSPGTAWPVLEPASPSIGALDDDPATELLNLSFTGYAWLTSISGTTGVAGLEFDIDESFFDLLSESDQLFGLMGSIDAEYKRLVFQLNGVYTHAEFSDQKSFARSGMGGGGPTVSIDPDLKIDAGWVEVFGGYRFIDRPLEEADASAGRLTLDGFIGGRITLMEVEADIVAEEEITLPNGTVLAAGERRKLDQDEGWIEPFIGGRIGLELGEHWLLSLRGDVGGFGVDHSDFSWQAIGGVGYRWQHDGWSIDVFGGYRALGQDYTRGGFTWDAVTHGPVLGTQVSISF